MATIIWEKTSFILESPVSHSKRIFTRVRLVDFIFTLSYFR